jgi:hypothetical protein
MTWNWTWDDSLSLLSRELRREMIQIASQYCLLIKKPISIHCNVLWSFLKDDLYKKISYFPFGTTIVYLCFRLFSSVCSNHPFFLPKAEYELTSKKVLTRANVATLCLIDFGRQCWVGCHGSSSRDGSETKTSSSVIWWLFLQLARWCLYFCSHFFAFPLLICNFLGYKWKLWLTLYVFIPVFCEWRGQNFRRSIYSFQTSVMSSKCKKKNTMKLVYISIPNKSKNVLSCTLTGFYGFWLWHYNPHYLALTFVNLVCNFVMYLY